MRTATSRLFAVVAPDLLRRVVADAFASFERAAADVPDGAPVTSATTCFARAADQRSRTQRATMSLHLSGGAPTAISAMASVRFRQATTSSVESPWRTASNARAACR